MTWAAQTADSGGLPSLPSLRADDLAFNQAFGGGDGLVQGFGLWGRGYYTDLTAEKELTGGQLISFEGDVTGFMLGGDLRLGGNGLLGVALNISEASIDWDNEKFTGVHDTSLGGVHTYYGHRFGEEGLLWAAVGIEQGDMELTEDKSQSFLYERDLEHRTLALGAVVPMATWGQQTDAVFKLGLIVEALHSKISDDARDDTGKLSLDSGWRRTGVQFDYGQPLGIGEIGAEAELTLRADYGDALTGLGVEFAGGVDYAMPAQGLRFDLRLRYLVTHEEELEEMGVSTGVIWQPDPEGKGFSFTFAPEWGSLASTQAALWAGDYHSPALSQAAGAGGVRQMATPFGGGGATTALGTASHAEGSASALGPPTANACCVGELPLGGGSSGAAGGARYAAGDSMLRYRLEARYGLPVLQGRELLTLYLRSTQAQQSSRHALGADINLGPHFTAGLETEAQPGFAPDHRIRLSYQRRF